VVPVGDCGLHPNPWPSARVGAGPSEKTTSTCNCRRPAAPPPRATRLNIPAAMISRPAKNPPIEFDEAGGNRECDQLMIMLVRAIEAMYSRQASDSICVVPTNGPLPHAQAGAGLAARRGSRIKLHFISRLMARNSKPDEAGFWGCMHKHVTHNRCHSHVYWT